MARGDFEAPEAAARRRRRKELASYLELHQERLEKIAQRCVNRVLQTRPLDPYEEILHLLSEHTQEGICFRQLRFWPKAPAGIALEVVAEARGSVLAVHRGEIPAELAAKALHAGAEAGDSPQALAVRLREAVGSALCGVKALDFQELDRRLLNAVATEGEAPSQDAAALCAALASELLVAAGCLLDVSAAEAVRSGLELRKEVVPGPPLVCQEDLEAWGHRWPELLLPAVQGSTAKRRLCVGASLWAALLPEAPAAAGGGPAPTWVDYTARRAREAALQDAEAADQDMDDPDEAPAAEPDELCPPTNSLAVALALADAVAAKIAVEVPALPAGDDFTPALEAFRRTLEALVPSYLRPARPGSAAGSADGEGAASDEPEEIEPLAAQQWRGSLYCTLHLDADAAFDPATGSYTFTPDGTARTQAELIEHYAALCKAEPLVRALVSPLSPRDADGLAVLRGRLPPEVIIVQEPREHAETTTERATGAQEDVPGLGHLRDVSLTPLGLAAHCEARGDLYAGKCGLYDFGEHAALLPSLRAYLDVSIALPEQRRCFLLPKGSGGKELSPALQSLDQHLCRVITSAYGQKNARDGREKHRNINARQWKEGLRRLNYPDVDSYAEPLFKFLDLSNNGSISATELGVMQDIDGPASLQDLDEFRIWLCACASRRRSIQLASAPDAASPTAAAVAAASASPLAALWRKMDGNGSGLVSFGEFKRALRKMRHPATMEGGGGKLKELFMCLDLKSEGNIGEDDFHCLNILSAKFQLDRLIRVRNFLKEKFGTLKAAFKAMDENRSGSLSQEEWMGVMEGKQSYPVLEDCSVCFQFFDKDGANCLTGKDFDLLGGFDEEKLLDDTQSLYEHLCDRYADLEEAFTAFLQQQRPGSRPGAAPRQSIDAKDFLAGCKSVQFKGSTDPRLLFNFLDAMHVGRITLSEFAQMGNLGAVDDLQERSDLMQGAISSLKAFAAEFCEGQAQGKEEGPWACLHRALRDATHGDLDLS